MSLMTDNRCSGGAVDDVEALRLLRRYAFPAQDIRHADNAVHRRADFVTHIGQEGALGDVGCFGLTLRESC